MTNAPSNGDRSLCGPDPASAMPPAVTVGMEGVSQSLQPPQLPSSSPLLPPAHVSFVIFTAGKVDSQACLVLSTGFGM